MDNNTQEQLLNESLAALRKYKEGCEKPSPVIHGDETLGEEHTRRLLESGHLKRIKGDWYYITHPGDEESDWYKAYWPFIVAYCDRKLEKEDWSLSADDSLLFHAAGGVIPRQLTVRSGNARNVITELPFGCELVESNGCDPYEPYERSLIEADPRFGVRIYKLNRALMTASPGFFRQHPMDARTCLAMMDDPGGLIRMALRLRYIGGACRVAGGLRSIGNPWFADYIMAGLRDAGCKEEEKNPFREDVAIPMDRCAVSSRMRLMWREMRPSVLEAKRSILTRPCDWTAGDVLRMTTKAYVRDSVNSLRLDGYDVDEELMQKTREGGWEVTPHDLGEDYDLACSAQGYFHAFEEVESYLQDVMTGIEDNVAKMTDHEIVHWFDYLVPRDSPAWDWEEIIIWYRETPLFIHNSRHIPADPGSLDEAMTTLWELMAGEPDAFVRAVMAHFLIAFLHPFVGGNGVLARFLTNTQLVSGGYPWIIIPGFRDDEYKDALEKACVQLDITAFAELIAVHIDRSDWTA